VTTDNYVKYKIPESWKWVKLEGICAVTDRDHRTPKYTQDGIPLISPKDFNENGINFSELKSVDKSELEAFKKKCNPEKGDILYSRIGTIGEARLFNFDFEFVALHSIALIKPLSDAVQSKYLLYLLQTPDIRKQALHNVKSVGTPDLGLKRIKNFDIPLAPLDQQKLIVSEIEKQFSRLDEAVAALRRIQANLKRYKASVLKSAVEGKLTEQWRKEHPDVEQASQVLKRILAERKKKWEEDYVKKYVAAHGHAPKDDLWKKKYKEPALPDISNLPELSKGWVWATIEQLSTEFMNGYGKRSQVIGMPRIVLRLADIINGEISYADVRRINCTDDEMQKYALSANDLLILRVNGSPDLVGRVLLVRQTPEEVLYCDHFIRVRCSTPDLAVWLRIYGDVERFRRYIDLNKVSSAGQNTVSQGMLSIFAVPLPPIKEQHRIVAEIDSRLSIVHEVVTQADVNIKRTDRLRQSILKKAFSGRLV